MKEFRRALIERGWTAPGWPKEYGGADLSVEQQFILNEVLAGFRAPGGGGVPDLVGATLLVHGSEEMKRRFLPGLMRGEERWAAGLLRAGRRLRSRLAADAGGPRRR